MPTIKETRNQMIQLVFPEHTNNLGTLHGGKLMDWIMLAATITSSKFARGITVLGTTDSIDFINPVKAGEILLLDSWVEYVGHCSLEIGVRVHSENPETGEKKLTTSSHLAFVAVDKLGKPVSVLQKITPEDEVEEAVYTEAKRRKDARLPRIKQRELEIKSDPLRKAVNMPHWIDTSRFKLETTRPVMPEDTFYGNFMSVGKLMKDIDETAAILSARFVRGTVVTGSLDDLYFYSPISVGEVVTFKAGITHVGKASLEVGITVLSEDLATGIQKYTCTAFLSFVHLSKEGRPQPIPQIDPETRDEIMLWDQAEQRKNRRTARVKNVRKSADSF